MTGVNRDSLGEEERECRWFHGTRRGFTRGGLVVPRSVHGGPGTSAPLNPGRTQPATAADRVYLTADLDLAWVYAWHAPGRGRPKVLVATPLDVDQDEPWDPEHSPEMRALRCGAARVVDVLTNPTVAEEQARSGWVLATR